MSVNLLIFLIVVPAFSPIFAVLKDDFFFTTVSNWQHDCGERKNAPYCHILPSIVVIYL